MNAEIKDGMLHVWLPMQTPAPSTSGKTLIVASTALEVNGKTVKIGVNAYIEA